MKTMLPYNISTLKYVLTIEIKSTGKAWAVKNKAYIKTTCPISCYGFEEPYFSDTTVEIRQSITNNQR